MTTAPTILLLDDEPLLRQATALLLRRCGGRVSTAASTVDAIRRVRSRPFDVAIVDLSGATSAPEILAALRAAGCEARRVVVCADAELTPEDARNVAAVLRKPYPFARLLRAVFGPQRGAHGAAAPARRVPTPRRRAPRAPADPARRRAADRTR
jgi:CheY-like chemotaxis protein